MNALSTWAIAGLVGQTWRKKVRNARRVDYSQGNKYTMNKQMKRKKKEQKPKKEKPLKPLKEIFAGLTDGELKVVLDGDDMSWENEGC